MYDIFDRQVFFAAHEHNKRRYNILKFLKNLDCIICKKLCFFFFFFKLNFKLWCINLWILTTRPRYFHSNPNYSLFLLQTCPKSDKSISLDIMQNVWVLWIRGHVLHVVVPCYSYLFTYFIDWYGQNRWQLPPTPIQCNVYLHGLLWLDFRIKHCHLHFWLNVL